MFKHTCSWRVNLLLYQHFTDKQKYFYVYSVFFFFFWFSKTVKSPYIPSNSVHRCTIEKNSFYFLRFPFISVNFSLYIIYTYIHIYTHIYISVCVCVYIYIHIYWWFANYLKSRCTSNFIYIIYIYIHTYIHLYICICIYNI